MGHQYVLVQVSIFQDVLEMSTPNITGTCNPPPFRMDFSRIDETAAEIVPLKCVLRDQFGQQKGTCLKRHKVIIKKSRGEVSLMEQATIVNVS